MKLDRNLLGWLGGDGRYEAHILLDLEEVRNWQPGTGRNRPKVSIDKLAYIEDSPKNEPLAVAKVARIDQLNRLRS